MRLLVALTCLFVVRNVAAKKIKPYENSIDELRIIHTNDIHSHLDQFNTGGTDCSAKNIAENKCFGGIARIRTEVDRIRAANENVLLFDAGDQFQGTMFFNFYKGAKAAEFMNDIKYDLMCVGNHEFDVSEQHLFEFFSSLTFPVVSANIDMATTEYLQRIVHPYTIIKKYNLGVVGFITNTTQAIAMGARNITFHDPVGPVQRAVDALHRQGVRRIIAVSHNGYDEDMMLAASTRGINLIVGGHSHSLLLKNVTVPGVVGRYPTPVTNLDGGLTYIVQAHRWGDYLGNVLVKWDHHDRLVSVEGDPILLDQTIPRDNATAVKVAKWRQAFDEVGRIVEANSTGSFAGDCKGIPSCPMGELMTDAMLAANLDAVGGAQIAMMNGGGVRATFPKGPVTFADVLTAQPFANSLVYVAMTGSQVLDVLEASAAGRNQPERGGLNVISNTRWSGLRYSVSPGVPAYSRISNVSVRTAANTFAPIDLVATYTIATNDFVALGGDNILPERSSLAASSLVTLDLVTDAMIALMKARGTISPELDGRVTVVQA